MHSYLSLFLSLPFCILKANLAMTHMLLGKINLITNLLFSILLDADMEDYGFEYSEEEQEEQDVDIENQYYNAKGISV
jgi:hypothetical protein